MTVDRSLLIPLFYLDSKAPCVKMMTCSCSLLFLPRRDGSLNGKTGEVFACVWKDDGFVWRGRATRCLLVMTWLDAPLYKCFD